SDRFVEDGDPYTITSCLAYNWLYRHNVVDYIVYPSFQTMSETCNIAFAPNFADEFMRLDRVFRLRIHQANAEAATFEITHVGENWGNMIAWRKPRHDESFDWIGVRGDIFPVGSWPDDVELDQSAPFQD